MPRWLKLWFLGGTVVVLWAAAALFIVWALSIGLPAQPPPGMGEIATVLFGASSVALIIFSLLFGAFAISGWQSLKTDVKKELEAKTERRIVNLEKELRGRIMTLTGFMLATLHSDPAKLKQSAKDKDYLAEAVLLCKKGYGLLKDLDGLGKYMALNNEIYYSCLLEEPLLHDYAMERARELNQIGTDYQSPTYVLTYCRVVLQYGKLEEDAEELKRARTAAQSILEMDLTKRQRDEAKLYEASLSRVLGVAGPEAG
jgi:hypothetical protein